MSFSEQNYQMLVAAIAKGVTTVKLGNGEEVTYRSLDEMLRIKRLMEDERNVGPPRGGIHYPTFSRRGR